MESLQERDSWGHHIEFVLACVGYSIGLGNIWRFPYLVYENGGASFLIPYVISLFVAGLPVFYLEMTIGQFASFGPIDAFASLAPIFRGVGWSMACTSFLVAVYYNVVIAWTVLYLFYSFRLGVPWATCTNDWNTFRTISRCCVNIESAVPSGCTSNMEQETCSERLNVSLSETVFFNKTCYNSTYFNETVWPTEQLTIWKNGSYRKISPSEEFYNRQILGLRYNATTGGELGFDDMGTLKWDVALSLFVAWALIFLCLAKGVQSLGKVLYFTAVFPYIILTILLVRGVTLEGAGKGLEFYLKPNITKLSHVEVWGDAASQVLFSLGPGFGSLLTMASFNKFKNNCLKDATVVAIINCATSFFAGIAVFSVMGFMAHEQGVDDIRTVVRSGPGLTFIAYPEAISRMWFPPIFAVTFFLMIFLLGINTQFVFVEVVVVAITDRWKWIRGYRPVAVGLVCFAMFLVGLPMCMDGGLYIFELLNKYTASYSLMVIVTLECLIVSYVYGLRNFSQDLHMMMGVPLSNFSRVLGSSGWYWKISWAVLTPLYMLVVLVLSVVLNERVRVGEYTFPWTAEFAGWLIACVPIVVVAVFAVYQLLFRRCYHRDSWKSLVTATEEWCSAEERERFNQYINRNSLSRSDFLNHATAENLRKSSYMNHGFDLQQRRY